MRRTVAITGWTMTWAGLLLIGYSAYQLWVTDIVNERTQGKARTELAAVLDEHRETTSSTTTTTAGPTPVLLSEDVVDVGKAFAAIRIPKIGLDAVVFEGVDTLTLRQGPGHMPWTPLPGQPGNAVVSGHRTTYGRPFFDLDLLAPGDVIEVESAAGGHTYTVRELMVVKPTDVWVTDPRDGAWLTLTTCEPRFSARERLIVFAEMTAGPNFEYIQSLALPDVLDPAA